MGLCMSLRGSDHVEAVITEKELPHNYEIIIKDADSPINDSSIFKIYKHLQSGVFLNQKRKKYWVAKNSGDNCFMLFARDLSIIWGNDKRYWDWPSIKETPTSDEFIEVAEILNVCWLEVSGKFDASKLSPSTTYEIVFEVMLKDPTNGWDVPVNLRLIDPNQNIQEHKVSLLAKPKEEWIQLHVGEFTTSPNQMGEIQFSLFECQDLYWKRGLIIKGVAIRPKISV